MATIKNATMTWRVDRGAKGTLRAAAARGHRAITKRVELLLREYWGQNRMPFPGSNARPGAEDRT